MSISIITPTIGTKYLKECIESVKNQTYTNFKHIIVVDGKEYEKKVRDIVSPYLDQEYDLDICVLPQNSGKNGYVCHPKYAAFSYLCNTEYITFLDEDNVLAINHLDSMIDVLIKDVSVGMVYSLRYIIDKNGDYLCKDMFESIGNLGKSRGVNPFIDSSCICLRLDVARRYAHYWMSAEGTYLFEGKQIVRPTDKVFSKVVLEGESKALCTMQYTLGYRVYENKPNPPEFFLQNSRRWIVEPWNQKPLYLCHFSPIPTNQGITHPETSLLWKEQWQLPIVGALKRYFEVKDGYQNTVPPGSTVLFTCCHPSMLPERLHTRKDIRKVLLAMESPNYRHRGNFAKEFIDNFDMVITYNTQFKEVLGPKYKHILHPYNTDTISGTHRLVKKNKGICRGDNKYSVCIVLENRQIKEEYEVLGVKLRSLDYLRYEYAKYLPIDCYGRGWNDEKALKAKGYDPRHPSDIMNDYTFTLITENQNATGGTTEKIYDALTSGSIPLYYSESDKISNIPDECWINIAKIKPEELPKYLDSVDIEKYRQNIYKYRETILSCISVDKMCERIYEYLS